MNDNQTVINYVYYNIAVLKCQYRMVIEEGGFTNNYYPRLKDMREDHDFSQQYIAEFLNMKQPQYSRYERGLRDVPTDVLIRLANLYNTSVDYLLGITNNSTPYGK